MIGWRVLIKETLVNKKPLVSIMIPTYNRESLIEEALMSALAQDYENFEVVVVDNKSTDRTFDILKTYEKSMKMCLFFKTKKT